MQETWTTGKTASVYERRIQSSVRHVVEEVMRYSPENIHNRHQLLNCVLVALTKTICEIQQAINPSLTDVEFAHKLAKDLIATYEQWDRQKKTVEKLKGLGS